MPSRRENKRRADARHILRSHNGAASVIQEVFRWYHHNQVVHKFSRSNVVDHVCKWQMACLKPRVPIVVQTRRSCLSHRLSESVTSVTFGNVTYHEASSSIARQSAFHSELSCKICMQLSDAPMFANCCPTASNYGCVCYGCAYTFLQMNINPAGRYVTRSWSASCERGCLTRTKSQDVSTSGLNLELFGHTHHVFFDRLRDEFGSSKCFACGLLFETTAALRRHLQVSCQNVSLQCNRCLFYGSRHEVSEHRKTHEFVECPCCGISVQIGLWSNHMEKHNCILPDGQIQDVS